MTSGNLGKARTFVNLKIVVSDGGSKARKEDEVDQATEKPVFAGCRWSAEAGDFD
jgi:hypothetical protein